MGAKRYFWNMKHHRELDKKMGLSKQMVGLFAELARACGMETELAGTRGMMPVFLFMNLDKVLPERMRGMVVYDFNGKGPVHRFHRVGVHKN